MEEEVSNLQDTYKLERLMAEVSCDRGWYTRCRYLVHTFLSFEALLSMRDC